MLNHAAKEIFLALIVSGVVIYGINTHSLFETTFFKDNSQISTHLFDVNFSSE